MADEDESKEVTNVVVAVRCRPMNKKESGEGATEVVNFLSHEQLSIEHSKGETAQFAFDHIFPSTTSQASVFDTLGVALLDKAFAGFNSTIFAYGQTGSGKTHTMLNHKADADHRGLIPRISDSLYSRIADLTAKHETRKFLVCCSFMEIYNEIIYDLLVPKNKQPKGGLEVREQKGLGVYVKDLQEMVIETSDKLQQMIEQGFEHRATAATRMNDASSRSHCIFVIKLHQKDVEDGAKNTFSKLNLVDLAGSERAKSTEAEGDRLKEGANINKSLSALGNVINALSSQSSGKKAFVPYRNSKLTRVLQESLGGNSLCTMVAAISPSSTNADETLSTLNYAKRAKMIRVTATKNDEASQVKKLEEEVQALRKKLESQAAGEAGAMTSKEKEEMESKYGAQIDELQSFMKQNWEEKQKLSEKYEEEQKKAAEEAAKAAERVMQERARRLQLLEQNGDIELTLKAISGLGTDLAKGLPDRIGEALKVQQQIESQLHAVRLYRESAASDFQSCAGCKPSDVVALQTLLSQVHAKLGSMTKELDVLVRLEGQLDETMGRIAPQVALAARQADDRAREGQEENEAAKELAELLGVVQRQLAQRQAGRHTKLAEDLQKLGLVPESQWLASQLGAKEDGAAQALTKSLKAKADGELEPAGPQTPAQSGPAGVLGLSTFELGDERLKGSSNSDAARCARLLQPLLYGGWCPEADAPEEYLEVDLGEERTITGMSIQGRLPCTSEWTQTRDLLHLSLAEMTDKLPTAEKIFKRPPVRLIHDIGVIMAEERHCFAPWRVPPELLDFAALSREQKVTFFQELIERTNQVGRELAAGGGAGLAELAVTPQDILKGNNCDETNRMLQVLAYLGMRSQIKALGRSVSGLLDFLPQWTERWKLRFLAEGGDWQWYKASKEAGEAHVFEGASDAVGTHFVGLPSAVAARRIRVHPVQWHRHAALRCEVHVLLPGEASAVAAAPSGPGRVRNATELKGWTSLTCDAIVEVQKGIEEARRQKQQEEDAKAAAMMGQKDAAEQERNQLAEQLKAAQQRYDELEAQRQASEQRAVAAETALLQMQVERDRLQSRTEQLETEITEKNEAKAAVDEQCEGLREQCEELRAAQSELETQLQVMTEERDVARSKEEEYFEYSNAKEEELVDTNNGYVYLTERLQEKEEEIDQLHESNTKLQESNDALDDRCKKLADENLNNLGEQQKLRTKLAEEERAHKAVQERYMKLLKSNMSGGNDEPLRSTASTTDKSGASEEVADQAPDGEKLYEDDFENE